MIKLSIIVAIYNVENYIEKCLESLINQQTEQVEIICVNDGSTDNSYKILNQYKLKDSRIKVINKENGGVSSARNIGLKNAEGEYIFFIDGDDFVDSCTLKKLINILNTGDVDTLFMGYYRIDWNKNKKAIYPKMDKKIIFKNEIQKQLIPAILGLSLEQLYTWFDGGDLNSKNEMPTVWRFIYNNNVIKKYNIQFNESLITGEDIIFNVEYLHYAKNVHIIKECFYYYVWRQASLTQSYDKKYMFYQSKVQLMNAREELNKNLKLDGNQEYSNYYKGSIILSNIQIALTLSDCKIKEFNALYKLFKEYSSKDINLEAYKLLELKRAPLKYKIPLYLCKRKFYFILFMICYLINKVKISIKI